MYYPRLYVATLAVLAACGGRTSLSASPPRDGSGTNEADSGSGLADAADTGTTCSPDGVRLCGGACKSSCPLCTPLQTGVGATSEYGVCWADLSDQGNTPCALCDDGQGCVQRSPGKYVCVPLGVCQALRSLGQADVCWYGDKMPFDGSPVPTPRGCAASTTDIVCGGDCPPCGARYTLPRCVGRGPDHPFGTCPVIAGTGNDVGSFPTCALLEGGYSAPCPMLPGYPYVCAVSPYPPGDAVVARLNGYCLSRDLCSALASALPGGLWCFDASGTRVAP